MFKVQPIYNDGLKLICDTLDEDAMLINKNDLELKVDNGAYELQEFDIPKKYLTMDIIDDIIRLNTFEDKNEGGLLNE